MLGIPRIKWREELSLQIKGHDEAVPWVYEVDFFRIKHIRIPIPEPKEKSYK